MGFVSNYYKDKCVFLTGVTGFLGKVVLAKLLLQLPQIKRIYVLVRPKRDVPPRKRVKQIYKLPLFDPLREKLGDDFKAFVKSKVIAVSGDILQDRLGIDPVMQERMTKEVNVVMHGAATISFNEPILDAIDQNVLGTLRVWELAMECPNLEVFCHVSTAYTNSNKGGFIEEKMYKLPFDPERVLDELMHMNETELKRKEKQLLGKHPNTYTFTKSITEHLLRDRRGSVPLVFCRPSIINATARDPFPGWIDSLAAGASFVVGYGAGFIRFLPAGSRDFVIDQIPVDYVANCMIASSAYNAKQDKLAIYHIASSERNPVTLRQIFNWVHPMFVTNPHKKQLLTPEKLQWLTGPTARIEYNIRSALFWSVPVMLYTSFAHTVGGRVHQKKASVLRKVGNRVQRAVNDFYFFMTNDLVFSMAESDEIMEAMDEQDYAMFHYDISTLNWPEQIFHFAVGLRKYAQGEKDLKLTYKGDFLPPEKHNRGLYLKRRPLGDLSFATMNPVRFTIRGLPKTPPELRSMVFSSDVVQAAIRVEAEREGKSVHVIETRAKDILTEMGAEASPLTVRGLAWMFRKVYRRLYTAVSVNQAGVEGAKRAFSGGEPVVLLPSHRSYIDFLITSYIAYSFKLPLPHIAAGNDFLSMLLVRWLMRHAGAFFMRRSFGDDELYKAIFSEYTQTLLQESYPVEFFLEGTRSRSGKSLQPKFGLLSICCEAYFEKRVDDITFLPIAISYEKPVDEEGHIQELMGETKEKPTLGGLMGAMRWLLSLDFGRISVQFAPPFTMKEFEQQDAERIASITSTSSLPWIPSSSSSSPSFSSSYSSSSSSIHGYFDVSGSDEEETGNVVALGSRDVPRSARSSPIASISSLHKVNDVEDIERMKEVKRRKGVVERLGHHVMLKLNAHVICMSTGVVSALMLTHPSGLTRKQLIDKYLWLRNMIRERDGWVDVILLKVDFVVDRAVKLLGESLDHTSHGNKLLSPSSPLVNGRIQDKSRVHLSYFRNQIVHIFQEEGLLALALASFPTHQVMGGRHHEEHGKEHEENQVPKGVPIDALAERMAFIRNLLAREFIYDDESNPRTFVKTLRFAEEQEWVCCSHLVPLEDDINQQYTGEELITVPSCGERLFTWLCLLYWPFIESYWVMGLEIVAGVGEGRTALKSDVISQAQALGDRLWKERVTCHYETKSKETLSNALNTFMSWDVVEVVPSDPKRQAIRLTKVYNEDPDALLQLISQIALYRRLPLRDLFKQSNLKGLRNKLMADFPAIARL